MHWARDAAEARAVVLELCQAAGARSVTKSKSMVAEEIGLNEFLEANGIEPVETDLGEYILQLAGEPPSHIIGAGDPHDQGARSPTCSREHHGTPAARGAPRRCSPRRAAILRQRYLAADVGITGANFLIAETGSAILVTNEGNAELTQGLPRDPHRGRQPREGGADAGGRLHAAAPAGALGDRPGVLGLHHGADRAEAAGRSRRARAASTSSCSTTAAAQMLGSEFQDMLRCIRCGACMNHCPVYLADRRPRLRLGLSRARWARC